MPIHFQLAMERSRSPEFIERKREGGLHRSDRGGPASARASAAVEAISNHAPLNEARAVKREGFARDARKRD